MEHNPEHEDEMTSDLGTADEGDALRSTKAPSKPKTRSETRAVAAERTAKEFKKTEPTEPLSKVSKPPDDSSVMKAPARVPSDQLDQHKHATLPATSTLIDTSDDDDDYEDLGGSAFFDRPNVAINSRALSEAHGDASLDSLDELDPILVGMGELPRHELPSGIPRPSDRNRQHHHHPAAPHNIQTHLPDARNPFAPEDSSQVPPPYDSFGQGAGPGPSLSRRANPGQPLHQEYERAAPRGGRQGGMLDSFVSRFSTRNEAAEYENIIRSLYYENMHLNSALLREHDQNKVLNERCTKLKGENDKFSSELREMQMNTFKEMTKTSWAALDDSVVKEVFSEIHKDVEDWADEYCVEEFSEMNVDNLTDEEAATLMQNLDAVALLHAKSPKDQMKHWDENGMNPVLVLTAVINHLMCSFIFNNPFFVLDSLIESGAGGQPSEMTDSTFRVLCNINPKEAHKWRAQLMRTLVPLPPSGGRFTGLKPAKEDISVFIRLCCENLVKQLATSSLRVFLKAPEDADALKTLTECWVRCAELFVQLQTQLSSVAWTNPNQQRMAGDRFAPDWVEAHRCQAFQGIPSVGRRIDLVISPAVMFFGNEDGEHYEAKRVICKAVVLVEEKSS